MCGQGKKVSCRDEGWHRSRDVRLFQMAILGKENEAFIKSG